MTISVGILTVSDRCYRGESDDASGPLIGRLVSEQLAAQVKQQEVVPDEQGAIRSVLVRWCDEEGLDLILTTGGTGFAPRDVTPEATRRVLEREAPGLCEAMRTEGARVTPHAMLSRAVAGIRGQTLIVNLPGSPKAVREGLDAIFPSLPHGIETLKGLAGSDQSHEYKS